ncbi:UNVERIFIED_CONTAM: Galactinol synthase 3 [Siphonaria sp. JEL0065]|nr:Galactinol synthase 3 [Siphonaria sp. JEL0065]
MTLLATSSSSQKSPQELDWYSFGATLQSYLYNHHYKNETSMIDTEYVVMMTPLIPPHIRETLLSLGARLLIVPPLQIPGVSPGKGHQYEFVHTKLQMWRLEGVYKSILSIDADLFHIRRNPVQELFQKLEAWKRVNGTRQYFFGGCKDCCNEELNVGLFLFEPSREHFDGLVDKAGLEPYNKHMEQSLITVYFKEVTNVTWFGYDQNNMVTATNATAETVGYHYKFWDEKWGNAGEGVYRMFQERVGEMRRVQVRLGKEGKKGVLVPVFPSTFKEWGMVRDAKAMYHRVAILSMEGVGARVGVEEERTRIDFSERYAQADYFTQSQFVDAGDGLGGALSIAASIHLLGGSEYEWVWILSQGVYFSNEKLVHVRLGDFKDGSIILFKDCEGKDKTGSILIRRSALPKLAQYASDVSLRNDHDDANVMKGLLYLFGYNDQVKVHETQEMYWYQYSSSIDSEEKRTQKAKKPLIQFEAEETTTNLRGNKVKPPLLSSIASQAPSSSTPSSASPLNLNQEDKITLPNSINTSLKQLFIAPLPANWLPPSPSSFPKPKDADQRYLANHVLSQKDKSLNDDSSFDKGRLSERETEAIRSAVFTYLDRAIIDASRVVEFVKGNAKTRLQLFGDKHARFLPEVIQISGVNRTVSQVSRFLRDQLANGSRERAGELWTSEEDVRLPELALLYSNAWRRIEKEIGRVGCRERMRQLKTHNPTITTYHTGPFSLEEEVAFLRGLLLYHVPTKDTDDASSATLAKISMDHVVTRSVIALRKKFENGFRLVWKVARTKGWKGNEGSRLNEDVLLDFKDRVKKGRFPIELDLILFESLQATEAHDETEISWKLIQNSCKQLEKWQPKQLSRRWYLVKEKKAPEELQTYGKFQECLEHLIRVTKQEIAEAGKVSSCGPVSVVRDENDDGNLVSEFYVFDSDEENEVEQKLCRSGNGRKKTALSTGKKKSTIKKMSGKGMTLKTPKASTSQKTQALLQVTQLSTPSLASSLTPSVSAAGNLRGKRKHAVTLSVVGGTASSGNSVKKAKK